MANDPSTIHQRRGWGRALGAVAGGGVAMLLWVSPAAAQDPPEYVGQPNPTVDVKNDPPAGDVESSGGARSAGAAAAGGGLALTGTDIVGLTAVGLGALGTGVVLSRRSRRARRGEGILARPA